MALFDAQWFDKGRFGTRRLLKTPMNPVLETAMRTRMNDMNRAGIFRDFGNWAICWVDPSADQAACHGMLKEIDAAAREAVATETARIERLNRENRARAAAMLIEVERLRVERVSGTLRDLRGLLADSPWLWTGKLAIEAADLAAREDLDGDQWRRARTLVENARATRARATETLAEPDDGEGRLEGEALRAAVLEGCRYLSAMDADRATEANSAGWSRTTTVLGHLLSGMECLSVRQAAHGWRLLHKHRRQLPKDMRDRLGV